MIEGSLTREDFERALDAIPGLVWTARPDGFIDFLNHHWCEYTGLSCAEARGTGWRRAVHDEDCAAVSATWRQCVDTGTAAEVEGRLLRSDGVARWFLFRALPLFDDRGALVKWYGQTIDIHARKCAEALLAGEKRLLETMAEGQPLSQVLEAVCRLVEDSAPECWCGIVLVDPSGSRLQHGAAPSLPDTYNEAIGGRPVQLEAGPCSMAVFQGIQVIAADVASDTRWDRFEWRALAVRHGIGSCWSTPIRSKAGSVLGAFAIYQARAGHPSQLHQDLIARLTHIASIAIERATAEEALHKTRTELAHVARVATVGELTASMAHEVNQPLAGILTNANACLRLLAGPTPNIEGARETAQRTIRDANRASDVIVRLRALFRKQCMPDELVGLNEAIHDVLLLMRTELHKHGVVLESEFDPDLPAVLGDRVQLQQVVLNLVRNAIDAMSEMEGPRVLSIRTRPAIDSNGVEVVVTDSGVGLDPIDTERIFRPFYTTKEAGMGMGLSISRSIIEAHVGTLRVEPTEGPGATFLISLPLPSGPGRSLP